MFTVYTTTAFHCPYCERAKEKLTELGHSFVERDVSQLDVKAELRSRLPSAMTVPQIFYENDYIGDCDALLRLADAKVLDRMIQHPADYDGYHEN